MNNLINKVAIAAAAGISVLSLSSAAVAGEGGVAGAAAFTIDGTAVTGVAVAAAVGKQDAAASAYNVPTDGSPSANTGVQNYAYSLGSASVIAIDAMGDSENAAMGADAPDSQIGEAQTNTFANNAPGVIQIGTAAGETLIDFDSQPTP